MTVDIYGQKYTLMGESSTDHIQKVATYVDEKMNQISKKSPILDTTKISVLTAINIADELFRLQKEHEELRSLLEELTKE